MGTIRKNKIHIILTGGTIDSIWDGTKDTAVVARHSVLPEYFENLSRNLKFSEKFIFTEVCMKDSRDLTDKDRAAIAEAIKKSKVSGVIITHGTYTMSDTARYLKKALIRVNKTVVLTGSMVPVKGFDFSDGSFNLGYAIAQVQTLHPGVYVCMNARVFKPDEVAKNIHKGKFYSVFEEKQ